VVHPDRHAAAAAAVTISAVSWTISGRFTMPGLPGTLRPVQ
jgi:hypothetical protein